MSAAGQVVQALLPQRVPGGREQAGPRPCVVVGDFAVLGTMRYPMVLLVPLTSVSPQRDVWSASHPDLYPRLPAGAGGGAVVRDSIVLLDQLTSLDASRAVGLRGVLTAAELLPILGGLKAAIGS